MISPRAIAMRVNTAPSPVGMNIKTIQPSAVISVPSVIAVSAGTFRSRSVMTTVSKITTMGPVASKRSVSICGLT